MPPLRWVDGHRALAPALSAFPDLPMQRTAVGLEAHAVIEKGALIYIGDF